MASLTTGMECLFAELHFQPNAAFLVLVIGYLVASYELAVFYSGTLMDKHYMPRMHVTCRGNLAFVQKWLGSKFKMIKMPNDSI